MNGAWWVSFLACYGHTTLESSFEDRVETVNLALSGTVPFGEILELFNMVVPSYSHALNDDVVGTFFQVLTFNSTLTSLKLLKSTKVTNGLSQAP